MNFKQIDFTNHIFKNIPDYVFVFYRQVCNERLRPPLSKKEMRSRYSLSKYKLDKAIKILKDNELLFCEPLNDNQTMSYLSSCYRGHTVGTYYCCVCGKDYVEHGADIVQHHYPIRAKDGGKDTVKICAGCHSEFHTQRYYLGVEYDSLT